MKEQVYHRAGRGSGLWRGVAGRRRMDNVIVTAGGLEFARKVLYLPVTTATMTKVNNVIR